MRRYAKNCHIYMQCFTALWKLCLWKYASFLLFHPVVRNDLKRNLVIFNIMEGVFAPGSAQDHHSQPAHSEPAHGRSTAHSIQETDHRYRTTPRAGRQAERRVGRRPRRQAWSRQQRRSTRTTALDGGVAQRWVTLLVSHSRTSSSKLPPASTSSRQSTTGDPQSTVPSRRCRRPPVKS